MSFDRGWRISCFTAFWRTKIDGTEEENHAGNEIWPFVEPLIFAEEELTDNGVISIRTHRYIFEKKNFEERFYGLNP